MAYKTIITCDVCGNIINTGDASKLDIVYCVSNFENNQIPQSVHYDLCRSCTAKISNCVRNLKVNNEDDKGNRI